MADYPRKNYNKRPPIRRAKQTSAIRKLVWNWDDINECTVYEIDQDSEQNAQEVIECQQQQTD